MKKGFKEFNNGFSPGLITVDYPRSAVSEAYRTMRTNLSFASVDQECRLLLITSVAPSEGKTTTAVNLAVTLAQAGSSVLLVDCDLRRPSVHKLFGLENGGGLTNVLVQGRTPSELFHEGPVEGLKVLTSGPIPPNPAELLGSERTKQLWPQLLEEFDYVIIDSPPVLAVTDSVLLASQVHGVILVICAGMQRVDVAQEAKEQLLMANARILGVVLNKVKIPTRDYHYYYYSRRREEEKVRL
jgi:capsular exopolysaccharide synthesis family protein